jgi:hypothetical protein
VSDEFDASGHEVDRRIGKQCTSGLAGSRRCPILGSGHVRAGNDQTASNFGRLRSPWHAMCRLD